MKNGPVGIALYLAAWPCAVFLDAADPNPKQRYKVVQFDRLQASGLIDELHQSIARDTRRRLRAESASRVMHRGPRNVQDEPQTATTTA